MLLPLEPAITIFRRRFDETKPSKARLPDLSLASFKRLLT